MLNLNSAVMVVHCERLKLKHTNQLILLLGALGTPQVALQCMKCIKNTPGVDRCVQMKLNPDR